MPIEQLVEPAPLEDILIEQIEFLIKHMALCYLPKSMCAECKRLEAVKKQLLARFA